MLEKSREVSNLAAREPWLGLLEWATWETELIVSRTSREGNNVQLGANNKTHRPNAESPRFNRSGENRVELRPVKRKKGKKQKRKKTLIDIDVVQEFARLRISPWKEKLVGIDSYDTIRVKF